MNTERIQYGTFSSRENLEESAIEQGAKLIEKKHDGYKFLLKDDSRESGLVVHLAIFAHRQWDADYNESWKTYNRWATSEDI